MQVFSDLQSCIYNEYVVALHTVSKVCFNGSSYILMERRYYYHHIEGKFILVAILASVASVKGALAI